MKKRLIYILLFLIASALVWFGMMFKQAVNHAFDAENRGHMYRNFFGALEMYTAQTGAFPPSLDDMLIIETELGYEGVRWPEDAELIADLIQPNFDITPSSDNLNAFIPDYELKADWGAPHCEFYWALIIENLNQED